MTWFIRSRTSRVAFSAAALAIGLGAMGCGVDRVKVHGRVTKDGQPLGGHVQMMFYSAEKAEQGFANFYQANVQKDGTYWVPGPGNKGVRPGKYRIAISLSATYQGRDTLGGTFDAQKSPIIREVTDNKSTQEINIDLAKPAE